MSLDFDIQLATISSCTGMLSLGKWFLWTAFSELHSSQIKLYLRYCFSFCDGCENAFKIRDNVNNMDSKFIYISSYLLLNLLAAGVPFEVWGKMGLGLDPEAAELFFLIKLPGSLRKSVRANWGDSCMLQKIWMQGRQWKWKFPLVCLTKLEVIEEPGGFTF